MGRLACIKRWRLIGFGRDLSEEIRATAKFPSAFFRFSRDREELPVSADLGANINEAPRVTLKKI
jgi:hypothetical protein